MCDPMTAVMALTAVATAYSARQAKQANRESIAAQQQAQGDPAAERARAEAEAAQRANAQLAETNRRRREQGSLLAKGAPSAPKFTLGDSQLQPGQSPLGGIGGRVVRAVAGSRSTLISRGAPAAGAGAGAGGGRDVSSMALM